MCIAIYKPEGIRISEDHLWNCYESNDDGWGFAARMPNGTLEVRKGTTLFRHFLDAYAPYQDMQSLIHFRIKTHGDIDKRNCHPFRVSSGLAVIHNGIIPIQSNVDEKRSDTWHFVELVLKRMHQHRRDFWLRPEYQWALEQAIGYSKLAFLRADGKYAIYGEAKGDWDHGVWWSNTSYKYSKYVAYSRTPIRSAYEDDESYYTKLLAQEPKAEEKKPANRLTQARLAFDRASDEAAAWRQTVAAALFNEGLSLKGIEDVDGVFGTTGLEALLEISSQSDLLYRGEEEVTE
jgi:hypothetical protein